MTKTHERKFLITDEQLNELYKKAKFVKTMLIDQFQIGRFKYRHAVESTLETEKEYFVRYERRGEKLFKKDLTESEWDELVEGRFPILKRRWCYQDENWDFDIDEFLEPENFIMVEVSKEGKDPAEFVPPADWKEVTENPNYKNVNIETGSLDYEDLSLYRHL